MVEAEAKGSADALKELSKAIISAANQVETYVETQRTAEAQKIEKEKDALIKEKIRLDKAAEKAQNNAARKAASRTEGNAADDEPSLLFTADNDTTGESASSPGYGGFKALLTWSDAAAYELVKKTRQDVEGTSFKKLGAPDIPYAILNVANVQAITDDKSVKSAQSIVHVQFGLSDQAKKEKKGQYPLNCIRNDALRETILGYGPKVAAFKMSGAADLPTTAVRTFLKSVSHYCQLNSCVVNGEIERFGLPSWRYQTKGRRQVVVVSYEDIRNCFDVRAMCETSKKNVLDVVKDLICGMTVEILGDFFKNGGKVYRGEVAGIFMEAS